MKKNAKMHMKYLTDNGVLIKCCYCDSKDNCIRRVNKEKTEKMGIKCYCTLTPNRPKSFSKNKSVK